MKEIKDIEEKKMIMAYFFKRREGVSRNGLYLEWSTWWKEDFIQMDIIAHTEYTKIIWCIRILRK